ncbi:uncharacterized protein LOC132274889 [Cornus florida]|uniref:uncharacterized protein LOC132274889 n=1 Tax=Cornus florida TaxID=4283 RepID=UPI00289DF707|nr:uncharacterized protein LOC132274889 [Cornus florida]
MLWLGNAIYLEAILTQVSLHCKNVVGLGISNGDVEEDESLLIVTLLPNIKYLDLRHTYLDQEEIMTILKGCKKLLHFDVRDCKGFRLDDEILKLASHVPTFMYEADEVEVWSDDDMTVLRVYPSSGVMDENWTDDDGLTLKDIDDALLANFARRNRHPRPSLPLNQSGRCI